MLKGRARSRGVREIFGSGAAGLVLAACAILFTAPGRERGGADVAAAARLPTVAVMPFRDLSAGPSASARYIGEAIRETVTADLKQLGALRVVERGSLDKVLAEQNLQQQQEIDVATGVKLGKVLGASLLVIGAFQRVPPQLRLTARFVRVETSEVIGSAKVDGSAREFLRLQDKITASLLRSAGFAVHARQVLDHAERRPAIRGLKTLELYGQSVVASTEAERHQLLSLAVAEDKDFSYAARELAELEQRLKRYEAASLEANDRQIAALRERLRAATGPEREAALYELLGRLSTLRRWHACRREARAFLDPLAAGTPVTPTLDGIASLLIATEQYLKDYDGLLRDGERFLSRAPGSQHFASIKGMMEAAIQRKRALEEGKLKADAELADSSTSVSRWDLCFAARLYARHEQGEAAQRLYDACIEAGTHKPGELLAERVQLAANQGDWRRLRTLFAEWEASDPSAARQWRSGMEAWIPSDE